MDEILKVLNQINEKLDRLLNAEKRFTIGDLVEGCLYQSTEGLVLKYRGYTCHNADLGILRAVFEVVRGDKFNEKGTECWMLEQEVSCLIREYKK